MAGQTRNVKLRLENVCKTFKNRDGESLVLDNINLDIYDNEFVCVVGPSGCGKSTLLNILAGLTDASSGIAYCNGKPIEGTGTERELSSSSTPFSLG